MQTAHTSNNLKRQLTRRFSISAPALILLTVLWIALIANQSLWGQISDRLAPWSLSSIGYMLALLSLMVILLATPLLIVAQRWLLKPLLISLLLFSATLAYFTQQLGVIFDIEMVRNVVETIVDQNTQEGAELISWSMISFVALSTAFPLFVIARSNIKKSTLLQDQLSRVGWWCAMACITAGLVAVNFKYVTYFSRENHDLEVYLTPFYTVKTARQLFQEKRKASNAVFTEIGRDAIQTKKHKRRTVGVMVVGETARSDHFSLNGYARDTSAELAKRHVINFNNASSCGTSTAYSVPCMFSFLGQENYSPEKAKQESNVLDVLQHAGVKTVWVDSNSSCKGVCARVESINIMKNSLKILKQADSDSHLFVDGAWHDEKLLQYVDTYLDNSDEEVLLVLHTMGSHGPAYYRRYPNEKAQFAPFCQSKAPQDCSRELIVNAYDNTIAYTDHVLAKIIDKLAARDDDSFMLYASDHGESLGENGVYLHGLPRFIAPASQTSVPVIAWFSDGYINSKALPAQPLQVRQIDQAITHDNLSASLLGLFDVKTDLYQSELDLFKQGGHVFSDTAVADNKNANGNALHQSVNK